MRKISWPFYNESDATSDPSNFLTLLPARLDFDRSSLEAAWRREADEYVADAPFGILRLIPRKIEDLQPAWRVEIVLEIREAVRLHDLEIRYETRGGPVVKAWVPYLRPGADLVMADPVWRTPAVLGVKDGRAVAVVADVALWPEFARPYLNFRHQNENGNSCFSFGCGAIHTHGHVFFRKTQAATAIPAGAILRLAHYLLEYPEAAELPLAEVASFAWKRLARHEGFAPQTMPFAKAGDLIVKRIFASDLYHEFQLDGRAVAGMITQTVTAGRTPGIMNEKELRSYFRNQARMIKLMGAIQTTFFLHPLGYRALTGALHTGLLKVLPIVSFQCWFNQARTSLGAVLHAARTGDGVLAQRARRIIELALAAPMEDGCPPSICLIPENKVSWKSGTRAFEMIDAYHLPDAAVTAFHLLEWQEFVAPDPRILARCRRLAGFLLSKQDADGAVPSWLEKTPEGLRPQAILARSAASAAPAMFWARLYRLAPDERWLQAAKQALSFIEREVLPEEKWFDFELLYSCAGRPTGQDGPEKFTQCYPVNTLSMYWAARAALDIYEATNEADFLALAEKLVGRLSHFQQVFDHPRVSIDTFGGFAVMNADAEFNDARQGLFVPLYFDLYRATRSSEMLARAVAALRASCTPMLAEEMQTVAPGNMIHFRPRDRGSVLENYGHTGRDEMTAGYLSPDWGCGTALYAAGLTYHRFGQVYVDLDADKVWALDRCEAEIVSFRAGRLRLSIRPGDGQTWRVVVDDPQGRMKELWVNDRPAKPLPGPGRRFDTGL